MKTYMAKPSTVQSQWIVVDAKGQTLGRLASRIARVLQGKNKPTWTPHIDTGDSVIVINAELIETTGKKETRKVYYHHSGYIGGMKEITLEKLRAKKPERIIELAVSRMMPKGPLGRDMLRKLHVYKGPEHRHQAQQPKLVEELL